MALFERRPEAGVYIPASMNHGKVVYKKQERSRGHGVLELVDRDFMKGSCLVTPRYLHLFTLSAIHIHNYDSSPSALVVACPDM